MNTSRVTRILTARPFWLVVALLMSTLIVSPAWAFTVNVVNGSGSPVAGFRWLVEEDVMHPVTPGVPSAQTLSVNIHRTYAPIVASGSSATSSATVNVPNTKRYFVTVMPNQGYAMSGHQVVTGQNTVKVVVNPDPIETAQIAVHAFADNNPISGAPDTPIEAGLEGFQVFVYDFAGFVSQDALGNPLGTTYNQDGSVAAMGDGVLLTDANGDCIVKNLPPGKYGTQVVPPVGTDWVQTSTIEGTKGIDSWIRSGEPPYFVEFGIAFWHVFIGFVQPSVIPAGADAVGKITGRALYIHDQGPPFTAVFNGGPVPHAWVGLNNLSGSDEQIYAQPAEADGSYTIDNVPPGTYQLVIWDLYLDVIIDFRTVIVPTAGGTIALGDTLVNAWFGTIMGSVFYDNDEDGFRDAGEQGIPGQAINLRYADGTIYGGTATDPAGNYSLTEVFPWFEWTIQEVDYLRYKATGVTVTVDQGGAIPPGKVNNPQPQPENGGLGWRTEAGPSLLEAFQLYAGQVNTLDWGKKNYVGNDNGGITGIIAYATTRAEDDPRLGVMDTWEAGIPRVQVNLYQDYNNDKVIDDLDGSGGPTLSDVDNWPFENFPGPEDVDRNHNGQFDPGDALQVVWTDSWDDNLPTGCVNEPLLVHGVQVMDCAETQRIWNQVRPGVFDGGYAFWSYYPGGMVSGSPETSPLAPGRYIVETTVPPGYKIVKEEDKNVDFGDEFTPIIDTLLPECAGDPHLVPDFLALFPDQQIPTAHAGETRPLCDRRAVTVAPGLNAAANFFLFTEVPVSARLSGLMTDDINVDFDINSPQYGDKLGPKWIPISMRDFAGHEVSRVYTDEWGHYNALLPSTYTANVPTPTGVSPGVTQLCLNNPGPYEDPLSPGQMIMDPWYDARYGQTCQNLEFHPAKTTVGDTPVIPIAAFAAADMRLDCEFPSGIPVIAKVDSRNGGPALNFNALTAWIAPSARAVQITARGTVQVPNPYYDPNIPGSPPTVTRDYGFGTTKGQVLLGGKSITINTWSPTVIVATVPTDATTGQLDVVRGDNKMRSTVGVTLWINESPIVRVSPGQSIQAAIDSSPSGALILVAPGTYPEHLIMYKKQRIQGWGAYSTFLDAVPLMPGQDTAWDAKVQALINGGQIVLIDGARQNLFLERGSGILVASKPGEFTNTKPARIDGFTITSAIQGGGVFASSYARYLGISNNVIISNQGTIGGGIRVGWPSLPNANGTGYLSCFNENIKIDHNDISMNGSIDNGGGLALNNGADNYQVTNNFICGNYTLQYGGGVSHHGLSPNGLIEANRIVFNQSTDEGAGIILVGELMGVWQQPGDLLTPGTGSVTINQNLIQGNMSGDDGAGIRVLMASGQDVASHPSQPAQWYRVMIFNNMIVNNSSQDVGAGVSLDDAAVVLMYQNTVAYNDSTGTGVDAFGNCVPGNPIGQTCPPGAGNPGVSFPHIAGVASFAHSTGLQAAFAPAVRQTYSNPSLVNNIIYRNRTFWWDGTANGGLGKLLPDVPGGANPQFWDLGVYGLATPVRLNPTYSVLTSTAGYSSTNTQADPRLASPYYNVNKANAGGLGNLVYVTFRPITLTGNYHITSGSSAISRGNPAVPPLFAKVRRDYDTQNRPNGTVDSGADEYYSGATPPMALEEPLAGLSLGPLGIAGDEQFVIAAEDEQEPLTDDTLVGEDENALQDEWLAEITESENADESSDESSTIDDDDDEGGCGL